MPAGRFFRKFGRDQYGDETFYHGTTGFKGDEIDYYSNMEGTSIGEGFYVSRDPEISSGYANPFGDPARGGEVMPLVMRKDARVFNIHSNELVSKDDANEIVDWLVDKEIDLPRYDEDVSASRLYKDVNEASWGEGAEWLGYAVSATDAYDVFDIGDELVVSNPDALKSRFAKFAGPGLMGGVAAGLALTPEESEAAVPIPGPKGRIARYLDEQNRQVWEEYDEAGNLISTGGTPRFNYDRSDPVQKATPEESQRFLDALPTPKPRSADSRFMEVSEEYERLLEQYAEPDQVFRPADTPMGRFTTAQKMAAGAGAVGLGGLGAYATMASPGQRRREQRERLREEGRRRRLYQSLEDQAQVEQGIRGPDSPFAAAMAETLRSVPMVGDFIPGINQLEKYAWGDRFGRGDVAEAALTAADFLPFTGPPGAMAGILTPMKAARLEKGLKKALPDDVSEDVVGEIIDQIDKDHGLDLVSNLDLKQIEDFAEAYANSSPDLDDFDELMKNQMADYIPGELEELPEEELLEELHLLTGQHATGLISKEEHEKLSAPLYKALNNKSGKGESGFMLDNLDDLDDVPSSPTFSDFTPNAEAIMRELREGTLRPVDLMSLRRDYLEEATGRRFTADQFVEAYGPGIYGLEPGQLQQLASRTNELLDQGIEPSLKSAYEPGGLLKASLNQGFKKVWNRFMTNAEPAPMTRQVQDLLYDDIKKGFDPAYDYNLSGVRRGVPGINRFSSPHYAKVEEDFDLNEVGEPISMDLQSRQARMESMGYRPVGVHTTDADVDFDEFEDLRERGAVMYANENPELARSSAQHLFGATGERQMPVMFRGKIWGKDRPPEWLMPERMTQEEFNQRMQGSRDWIPDYIKGYNLELSSIFDEQIAPQYIVDPDTGDWVLRDTRRRSGYGGQESWVQPSSWGRLEEYEIYEGQYGTEHKRFPITEMYERMGYPGWYVQDEGGYSFATNSPERIRSRFARFNPRFKDSRNIMSSIGLTAIPGAAILGTMADLEEEEIANPQE